jgi:hypothetical protein
MKPVSLNRCFAGFPPARGAGVRTDSPRAQAICLTPAERPLSRIVTCEEMRLRQ